MTQLPVIEIEQLNKSISSRDTFQDIISVADIQGDLNINNPEDKNLFIPMRLNAVLLAITSSGTMDINLDYIHYSVTPNSFLMIMPAHTFQFEHISKDFKGTVLIASKDFFDEFKPSNSSCSITNYMELRKSPYTELDLNETNLLKACLNTIREKIRANNHLFQKELIYNSFMNFSYELANIFSNKKEMFSKPKISRKEELLEKFLKLLFESFKEKHIVTFYAEKLCITPQYLSLILKELTGKSANKWIDDVLIVEAKIRLKAPDATVQQVADELCFSDQSTFGKFFKKHIGISPMEYRKS